MPNVDVEAIVDGIRRKASYLGELVLEAVTQPNNKQLLQLGLPVTVTAPDGFTSQEVAHLAKVLRIMKAEVSLTGRPSDGTIVVMALQPMAQRREPLTYVCPQFEDDTWRSLDGSNLCIYHGADDEVAWLRLGIFAITAQQLVWACSTTPVTLSSARR